VASHFTPPNLPHIAADVSPQATHLGKKPYTGIPKPSTTWNLHNQNLDSKSSTQVKVLVGVKAMSHHKSHNDFVTLSTMEIPRNPHPQQIRSTLQVQVWA